MNQSTTDTYPKRSYLFPQNGDTFGLIVVLSKDHVVLSVYVRLKKKKHYDLYMRQPLQTIATAKVLCANLDPDMDVIVVKNEF